MASGGAPAIGEFGSAIVDVLGLLQRIEQHAMEGVTQLTAIKAILSVSPTLAQPATAEMISVEPSPPPSPTTAAAASSEDEDGSSEALSRAWKAQGWEELGSVTNNGHAFKRGDVVMTNKKWGKLGTYRIAILKSIWKHTVSGRRSACIAWFYNPEDVPYDGDHFLSNELFVSIDTNNNFDVDGLSRTVNAREWTDQEPQAQAAESDGKKRPRRGVQEYVFGRYDYDHVTKTLKPRSRVVPRLKRITAKRASAQDVGSEGSLSTASEDSVEEPVRKRLTRNSLASSAKAAADDDGEESYQEGDEMDAQDEDAEEGEEGDEEDDEQETSANGGEEDCSLSDGGDKEAGWDEFVGFMASKRNTKLTRDIEQRIIKPSCWRGHSSPKSVERNRKFSEAIYAGSWNNGANVDPYTGHCDGCGMSRRITRHVSQDDNPDIGTGALPPIKLGSECWAVYTSLSALTKFIGIFHGCQQEPTRALYARLQNLIDAVQMARRMQ
jgi:hypothetical protein